MTGQGTSAAPLHPHDPRRLGAYELVGRLGEGGQGAVYLGRDPHGRPVAVKTLHARLLGDRKAMRRFVRELRLARRVPAFCTARMLAADVAGEVPYFVSEYVPGPSLRELVAREGPLEASSLMRLAIGTATALAAIHRAGVVHRDFKPGNVLMGPDGPRVVDFGVARALDAESATFTSQAVGTPGYMAPEQVLGEKAGPRTDVFAWAGTILFAATGRPPFGDDSIPAVMHRILHARPDLSPLPPALADIAEACLAKDPARRPDGEEVLRRLLVAAGAAPGPATGPALYETATRLLAGPGGLPTRPTPAGRPSRRRAPLLAAGAAAAVLLTVVPVFVLAQGDRRPRQPRPPATVTVGFVGALSGSSAEAGREMREGARLAIEEHNAANPATRIRLVDYDTGGARRGSETALQNAVDAGAVAVIGPTESEVEGSTGVPLRTDGMPAISPGMTAPRWTAVSQGLYRRVVPARDAAMQSLAEFVVRSGAAERVAVIDDGEHRDLTDVFAEALKKRGVSVDTVYMLGFSDEHVRWLMNRLRDWRPQAVMYPGPRWPAAGLVEAAKDKGLKARFYVGEWALRGEPPPEGTVAYCGCLDPAWADARFRQRFQARFGHPPSWYAVEGYNAALPLVSAVKAGRTTREQIGRHLDSVDVPGLGQRLRFAPGGRLTAPNVYVYQVRQGRMTLLGTTATARL
ncbi:bifunctional serine/threonine-protein kinase/ABC transporter substrate-binding protein [Thermomonospora catenispora]|uniref:bifunctional serine/threonine-protein kinase/ABC transporter substrate-binding protein n=1 Tax=Thermomonospora catenispora TaxID=2493090 RepID=UPI001375E4DB|nr:bifunctional serine/threonine-protein kinase/ABC transporter substrate-binding protein [Thermomonospora catenispora]